MNKTISILLLLGGGVPQRGEVGGKEFLIDMIHRYFLLYLPPRPSGHPSSQEEGN